MEGVKSRKGSKDAKETKDPN